MHISATTSSDGALSVTLTSPSSSSSSSMTMTQHASAPWLVAGPGPQVSTSGRLPVVSAIFADSVRDSSSSPRSRSRSPRPRPSEAPGHFHNEHVISNLHPHSQFHAQSHGHSHGGGYAGHGDHDHAPAHAYSAHGAVDAVDSYRPVENDVRSSMAASQCTGGGLRPSAAMGLRLSLASRKDDHPSALSIRPPAIGIRSAVRSQARKDDVDDADAMVDDPRPTLGINSARTAPGAVEAAGAGSLGLLILRSRSSIESISQPPSPAANMGSNLRIKCRGRPSEIAEQDVSLTCSVQHALAIHRSKLIGTGQAPPASAETTSSLGETSSRRTAMPLKKIKKEGFFGYNGDGFSTSTSSRHDSSGAQSEDDNDDTYGGSVARIRVTDGTPVAPIRPSKISAPAWQSR
jgi:hypothetical protein